MIKSYKNKSTQNVGYKNDAGFPVTILPNAVTYLDSDFAAAIPELELTNDWAVLTSQSFVDEAQTSSDASTVSTTYDISTVAGVWLSTDTGHTGTNYFTGGRFSGKAITLGTALPGATTAVIINYNAMQNRVTTSGGVITKVITLEEISDVRGIKIAVVTTSSTMPAGAVITAKTYNSAGSLLETKTRTLGSVASTTSNVYMYPSTLVLATELELTIAMPQASGSPYTAKVTATPLTASMIADGAIFTIGSEGTNKIVVDVQLMAAGVNLTNEGEVELVLCSDDKGTTTVSSAEGIAIESGGKGKIMFPLIANNSARCCSDETGLINFEIEETTGASTLYMKAIFPDGSFTVSDAIIFS